jgi:myo-inositol 2-dehydrogenase / D-chiro-inositol 1-dehydrogenase
MPTAEPSVSWQRGRPYASFMERFHDAYAAELACFVEVASGRTANPCPPAEALEALYIAEACELSRHLGRPVDVAEVRAQPAGT